MFDVFWLKTSCHQDRKLHYCVREKPLNHASDSYYCMSHELLCLVKPLYLVALKLLFWKLLYWVIVFHLRKHTKDMLLLRDGVLIVATIK